MQREFKYGKAPDGTSNSNNRIPYAKSDYQAVLTAAGSNDPQSLVDALAPAYNAVITYANSLHGPGEPDIDKSVISNAAAIYFQGDDAGGKELDARVDDARSGNNLSNNLLVGGAGNDTLYGGQGADYLLGAAGNDILDGGTGDDTLIGGPGDDTLNGGVGNDAYYFEANEGNDTIVDSDRQGMLYVGSKQLKGPGANTGHLSTAGSITWNASDGTGTVYKFTPYRDLSQGGTLTMGTLTISQGALGSSGGQIVINNFDMVAAQNTIPGYLGIHFIKQVEIVNDQSSNDFRNGNYNPTDVTSVLQGKVLKTMTIYSSTPCDKDQVLKLTCTDGNGSLIKCDTGAALLDFDATGSVTLTIPAGSDSVTVGLVYVGDPTQSQTVQLTSTLVDPSNLQTKSPVSNLMTVTFDNSQAPQAPVLTNLKPIAGQPASFTSNGQTTNYTKYQGDDAGDLVAVTDSGQNIIQIGNGNSSVTGGLGADSIVVGNGNDVINGGGGKDWIFAGRGNDIVSGNGGKDIFILGNGKNRVYAGSPTDLSTAIQQSAASAATSGYGDFFALGNGNNTVVGGTANDLVALGSGNNLVVLGPGNSSVFGGVALSNGPVDSDSWGRNGGQDIGNEARVLQVDCDARDSLRIQDICLRIAKVVMYARGNGAMRLIRNYLHARQSCVAALRQKHHLVARRRAKIARQVQVLAGEVLVDEEDFHVAHS